MKKPAIFASVIIILAAAVYFGWQQYHKAPETSTSRTADYQLTAAELFAAYEENEISAHETYGGKLLEVQGNVFDSESDMNGITVLMLDAGHPVFGVKCLLSEPLKDGPKLETTVVVRGFCSGINGDVELNRCTLQPSEL
ncbi:MAG: hypothetical protein EA392_04485 [Cryomorphaceae bacterium]|nr:MAG: hypothetical protein EA392_04485 [Cryomorphaceae bacterium]